MNFAGTDVTMPLSERAVAASRQARAGDYRIALLIYHRDGARLVPLTPHVPVIVGRSPPSHVQILDRSLSRQHARFTLAGGVVQVEDLESMNGTLVREERVSHAEVRAGDEVALGRVIVAVRALTHDEGSASGLMSHEQLRVALEQDVLRARHFGRGVSILLVRAARRGDAHVSRWCARVQALLRPVDRVGLYGPDVLAILLPETGAESALSLARAITAPPAGDETPLIAGAAPFPDAATTAEALLDVCWSALLRATADQPVASAPLGARTRCDLPGPLAREVEPVAQSPAMRAAFGAASRFARSTIPVLLQGETGTGKEVMARAIHEQSGRRAKPMVCINCGAIPQQLIESTLFGHERGAFTGATQQQKGVFEAADGGTVFLDEIGELPPAAQAALLRVLETKRVTRIGSSKELEVDVRLIAATHRDIEAMCETGAFRLDLLYRLNAMTLVIPPLRERPEDIEPLALRFLEQAGRANGCELRGIRPAALALLRNHTWPGNVRELRNAIERAVIIADSNFITEDDLPERVRVAVQPAAPARSAARSAASAPAQRRNTPAVQPAVQPPVATDDLKTRLKRYEAGLILEALRASGWNQTEAARRLGMPLRTLVHKLNTLRIQRPRSGAANEEQCDPEGLGDA